MRTTTTTRLIALPLSIAIFAAILLLILLTACASTGPREKAVKTYAAIHALLVTTKDVEWGICVPVAATSFRECTNPTAVTLGLTNAKHQAFNGHLTDAFQLELKVGPAIKAWKAGEAAPQSLSDLLMVATEIVVIAKTFVGPNGQRILTAALDVFNMVKAISDLFSPAPLIAFHALAGATR